MTNGISKELEAKCKPQRKIEAKQVAEFKIKKERKRIQKDYIQRKIESTGNKVLVEISSLAASDQIHCSRKIISSNLLIIFKIRAEHRV